MNRAAATRRAQIVPLEPRRLLTAVSFPVDSASSFLQIYANLKPDEIVTRIPLGAQANGTDRASATGTLRADISKAGIRFLTGGNISVSQKSGAFLPDFTSAGSAAFALKGQELFGESDVLASINATLRSITLDATSSRKQQDKRTKLFPMRNAKLIGSAAGQFTSRGEIVASGSATVNATVANANASAKLTGGSGSYAITMPVNATFVADLGEGVLTYTLIGRIVGRQGLSVQAATLPAEAPAATPSKTTARVADDVLGTGTTIA